MTNNMLVLMGITKHLSIKNLIADIPQYEVNNPVNPVKTDSYIKMVKPLLNTVRNSYYKNNLAYM